MKRRTVLKLALGLIAVAAVPLFAARKPLLIAYHRWALQRTTDQIYSKPTSEQGNLVSYGSMELYERQDSHRNNLVSLGYYFHHTYLFDHLPPTGEVQRALYTILSRPLGTIEPHVMSRSPEATDVGVAIEVWDRADRRPEWDEFHRTRNVADFIERYSRGRATIPSSLFARTFIGRWVCDGQLIVTIRPVGDEIEIVAPTVPGWRMTTHDAEIKNGTLRYLERHVRDPRNDSLPSIAPGKVELRWIATNSLEMRVRTAASHEVDISRLEWAP